MKRSSPIRSATTGGRHEGHPEDVFISNRLDAVPLRSPAISSHPLPFPGVYVPQNATKESPDVDPAREPTHPAAEARPSKNGEDRRPYFAEHPPLALQGSALDRGLRRLR